MPGAKQVAKVVVYADDRTDLGREALRLFENTSQSIITIPTAGGLPFAIKGRSRYVGIEEIKTLAADLRGNG